MIGILGDIHGEIGVLESATKSAKERGAVALIQVGDFSFTRDNVTDLMLLDLAIPIYAIHGNHEDYDFLDSLNATRGRRVEFRARAGSVTSIPRADVLEIDGLRIACLGGAGSIDKDLVILQGDKWFEQEIITDEDVETLLQKIGDAPVHCLISHCPPQSVIQEVFEIGSKRYRKYYSFGVHPDWKDPSADQVQKVWEKLGHVKNFCGHMHRSVVHGSCQILNEFQLVIFGRGL
jgi:predicted phosphodiesterase